MSEFFYLYNYLTDFPLLQAVLFGKKVSKGSLNSRNNIESRRLRRALTNSSQTQRFSIESAEQPKPSIMQASAPYNQWIGSILTGSLSLSLSLYVYSTSRIRRTSRQSPLSTP